MSELPRDTNEAARRLAALTADLSDQIRRQWIAKHGDVSHRVIDNESHSDGDPFAAPAYYVRSRRHQGNSRRDHHED